MIPSISMRKSLAKEEGERKKFRAKFVRIGKKINYKGHSEETILLKNICDASSGKLLTDHVWFSYTQGFQKVQLKEGCVIEFEARVKKYSKGYVNKKLGFNNESTDFKLSNPTKIVLVNQAL
jgi:hypothetical protein